jgi:chromosome segregation ATPase
LQKYFSTLSRASKIVQERKEGREKLRGYLKKIKIVSSQTAKKSVISAEIERLEKHIAEMLDKRMGKVNIKKEKEIMHELKHKEKEVDEKIHKLNELLARIGKKVDEEKFKEELTEEEPDNSAIIEELENKLYALESKYLEVKDNKKISQDLLDTIKYKISLLKEKLRELKSR